MSTLQWLGATTFCLKSNGLTIFHDAWIERPSCLPQNPAIEEFEVADYIFVSHSHFDHVTGADKLAKQTNAIVVGSCETIRLMRESGVPEENLIPVHGGERVPLFTREVREAAKMDKVQLQAGPPGAPKTPHPSLAAMTVHIWPSLHAMLPGESLHDLPEVMDSGHAMYGGTDHQCSLDITRLMTHGLLTLDKLSAEQLSESFDEDMQSFVRWMSDPERRMSGCDGGVLMFNFLLGGGNNILFNGQLGAYDGILRAIEDKPTVAILAVPGRANLNGRPFDGSAADFLVKEVQCLGEPERVIWCLHDTFFVNPKTVDTTAASKNVELQTRSKIWTLTHGKIEQI